MKRVLTSLTLVLIALLSSAFARSGGITDEINAAAEKIKPKLVEWRRHFHKNPELSNREFKTAEFVAKHLK